MLTNTLTSSLAAGHTDAPEVHQTGGSAEWLETPASDANLAAVVRELRAIRDLLECQAAELLDADAVAQLLGISTATLYRLRATGRIPPPVKLGTGPGLVRWRRADLMKHLAELKPARS